MYYSSLKTSKDYEDGNLHWELRMVMNPYKNLSMDNLATVGYNAINISLNIFSILLISRH